jgi:UDP-glucose 4-epimerase
MIEHLYAAPENPARVVIMGATSFVGRHAAAALTARGVEVVGLGSAEVDLLAADGAGKLSSHLRSEDALVVISAIAPCKNPNELALNTRMMASVCDAVAETPVAHVIYISSDAVYDDDANPIDEATPTTPANLHGLMHVAREGMIRNSVTCPLAILRPSLLYGIDDPHNGYGPNRFRRLANDGAPIVLFGEGEERRDHVHIDDVGELIALCLLHRSQGVMNVATGQVASFRDIAEKVVVLHRPDGVIETTPRQGPMPHGGFRSFVIAECQKAFPNFRYADLDTGLARVHQQTTETS